MRFFNDKANRKSYLGFINNVSMYSKEFEQKTVFPVFSNFHIYIPSNVKQMNSDGIYLFWFIISSVIRFKFM